jgi:hypothetical protein
VAGLAVGRFIVSPETKVAVIEDITRMIDVAKTLYRRNTESFDHIEGCLSDRKIEIERGDWDEENNKV